MPRRRTLSSCLALAAVAATPSPARAQEPAGGVSYEPAPPALEGVTAGVLLSRRSELLGGRLTFKGTLEERFAGRTVVLQRRLPEGGWIELTRTVADASAAFRTGWRTDRIGRLDVRALPIAADGTPSPATAPRRITVYRPARATFFGPGLYGRQTACGQTLTPRLAGVAHRTLPCGTLVDLLYAGRTATVPVVDRGPFRAGHSWDLTAATARELGFTTSDTIGAVRVRDEPPVSP